ncbi:MAG: hypothetical protein M1835_002979 [Candelina submexicana]|nr:MAG: hypothetical protein M1835_002979 [Candelina submexicana]
MKDADRASPSPKLGARLASYLKATVYDGSRNVGPPSPVSMSSSIVAPPPRGTEDEENAAASRARSPFLAQDPKLHYEYRRDSGLASSNFTADGADFVDNLGSVDDPGARILGEKPPRIVVQQENHHETTTSEKDRAHHGEVKAYSQPNGSPEERAIVQPFWGITTDIPTGSFADLTSPGQLQFSKRGSMLIGGIKANTSNGLSNGHARPSGTRKQPNHSSSVKASSGSERLLSPEEEQLSQKVRYMYEHGDGNGDVSLRPDDLSEMIEDNNEEAVVDEDAAADFLSPSRSPEPIQDRISVRRASGKPSTVTSRRSSTIKREAFETAGGIEDWENVDGGDVDRYGFIVPRRRYSQGSSVMSGNRLKTPEPPRPQRVSTVLQLASEAPRRKRTLRRTPSNSKGARSATPQIPRRKVSSRSLRPPSSMHSRSGNSSPRSVQSPFRHAANRLPHNKDRRWMDEAGDMLTLPPGLADIVEHEEGGEAAYELKRKEWDREEKWRRMAKVVKQKSLGGGMVFEFNTQDPKLISRTWKGIPDRWRATAWHAFLNTSAKKLKSSPSDEAIISRFHELVDQSSPDDVQIDVDVPRTINGHIMFRRRYRGGQRLLFRVLHALSLYFPHTGYVQGMASSAATLLCYYDEDHTFVMLVRMWQLRGLERLYQPGFGGLMEALEELDKDWLGGGDVSKRLRELGIDPTSYGTRWYLTLFNYSIPFPAQLRVWDVFMLLGDADYRHSASSFGGGLDVLHATSAALIDGTREILLDSDFENAMKVLTSWIPIKDEELLMKVAKAEWKLRQNNNKRSEGALPKVVVA